MNSWVYFLDVRRLRAFRALYNLKFHNISFL
jgi:hypothetical protein